RRLADIVRGSRSHRWRWSRGLYEDRVLRRPCSDQCRNLLKRAFRMAEESFRKTYYEHEFTALGGGSLAENKAVIDAALLQLDPPLGTAVNEVRLALGGAAAIVEWTALPSAEDVGRVDALIPTIDGIVTTGEPFELEELAAVGATADDLVDVIDFTTPPLDGGTYQIMWASEVGMQATVANTGVRGVATFSRSDGATRKWEHHWDLEQPQTFGS